MRINYNAVEPYAVWRFGVKWRKATETEKKENPARKYSSDGAKFKPNSKLSKKLLRAAMKRSFHAQRINGNKGKAEQFLPQGVLKDKHLNEINMKRRRFR